MTIKQQGGIFGRNPTFNDLTVEGTFTSSGNVGGGDATFDSLTVDTNTLYVDATNDATLIGTTTWNTTYEPRLQVQDTAGDGTGGILVNSYKPSVTFLDFSGGTPAVHRIAADSGKLSFEIDTAQNGSFTEAFGVTAAGNIAMASGKGIDFSATSGTGTSELFDDYEEGTWTPVQGGGATVVGSFSSSGKYTKIGRLVTITGEMSASTTIALSSAGIIATGLPFAPSGVSVGGLSTGSVDVSNSVLISNVASGRVYATEAVSATASTIYFTASYEV